jgi:hypothetical protein
MPSACPSCVRDLVARCPSASEPALVIRSCDPRVSKPAELRRVTRSARGQSLEASMTALWMSLPRPAPLVEENPPQPDRPCVDSTAQTPQAQHHPVVCLLPCYAVLAAHCVSLELLGMCSRTTNPMPGRTGLRRSQYSGFDARDSVSRGGESRASALAALADAPSRTAAPKPGDVRPGSRPRFGLDRRGSDSGIVGQSCLPRSISVPIQFNETITRLCPCGDEVWPPRGFGGAKPCPRCRQQRKRAATLKVAQRRRDARLSPQERLLRKIFEDVPR